MEGKGAGKKSGSMHFKKREAVFKGERKTLMLLYNSRKLFRFKAGDKASKSVEQGIFLVLQFFFCTCTKVRP